tara:strand:+ start:7275 stop:7892 length:618 start_codon:yes stop_codon:yes gene_type:complete
MSDLESFRLSLGSRFIKRSFDILFSSFLAILLLPIISLAWLIASIETNSNGIFIQERIGKEGKPFGLLKIKTMFDSSKAHNSISILNSSRISVSGKFFRKYKIDELPQVFNIIMGSMSFVGPRPDVPGYADRLEDDDRVMLLVRPGITGPASIKYKNEENLLEKSENAIHLNDNIIWPDKVRINIEYVKNYSFYNDLIYIIKTIF